MSAIEYYNHSTYPAQGAAGSSSAMRAELELVEAGFGKLPDLSGNGSKLVAINSGGTAMEAITSASVAQGGTGRVTGTTAYALVATGTTATGAQQSLAAGATTEILVGGGASALPVWTAATGSGAPVRATNPTLAGVIVTGDIDTGGGTNVSNINMGAGINIVFEGTTDDAFETTLTAADPTADRTITLPNESLTVAGRDVAQTFSAKQSFSAGAEITGAALLGYGAGAGGTVTQSTSKATAVTLNKPSGQITMHNAALVGGAVVSFFLNNTLIADADQVLLTIYRGSVGASYNYNVWADAGAGSAVINVKNISGATLSEALVLNFVVIKGAAS